MHGQQNVKFRPSGLHPSSLPTKTLYTSLLSPTRATCPDHLIFLEFIIWIIFRGSQIMNLPTLSRNGTTQLHARKVGSR